MIYLQWASWLLFALAGYFCLLNFYLSFLRYPSYLWRGGSKESYRFISGIPILGSLIVYLLYRNAHLPDTLQIVAIILIAVDTGGIHWGIANMIFHGCRSLLRTAVSKNLISSGYANELCRPWKLFSLAVGIALLIWGSFYYQAPDWDIPISLIMAIFAYLTATWSMHVMVERQWRQFPLMLFFTWWTVDGCYALYWYFNDPLALEYMRSANAPASLCLYWICGLIWYWQGSLEELMLSIKHWLKGTS